MMRHTVLRLLSPRLRDSFEGVGVIIASKSWNGIHAQVGMHIDDRRGDPSFIRVDTLKSGMIFY